MKKNSQFNKNYSRKPKRILFLWVLGIVLTVFGSMYAPDSRVKKDDNYDLDLSIEGLHFKYDNLLYDEEKGIYQFDLNIYDTSAYVKTGDMSYQFCNKYGDKIKLKFYEHMETDLDANQKAVDRLVRTYQFKLDDSTGLTPEDMWFIFASIDVTAPLFNVETQTEETTNIAKAEIGFDYRMAEPSELTDVDELRKKVSADELDKIERFKNQIKAGTSPASVREEQEQMNDISDNTSEEMSSEVTSESDGISIEERNQKIELEVASLNEQLVQHQTNIDNYNKVLDTKSDIEDITKLQNLITNEENTISDINDRIDYLNQLKSDDTNESEY